MIEPPSEMIDAIQALKPLDLSDAEDIARAVLEIAERTVEQLGRMPGIHHAPEVPDA